MSIAVPPNTACSRRSTAGADAERNAVPRHSPYPEISRSV
jgi:hypothetical protein